MFRRNKDPPLEQMQVLYQQLVNSNLTNLTYWQQGRYKDSVLGFRTLHQQADSKLETWNRESKQNEMKWTSEDVMLLDELNKVRAEIEDNWLLVEKDYESAVHYQQQQQQQQQQEQIKQQKARETQLKSKQASSSQANRLLKRSMRPHGGLANNSSNSSVSRGTPNGNSSASNSAKQAANLIWAPSNSMNTQHSNSLTSNSSAELFAGFDSSDGPQLTTEDPFKPRTIPTGYKSNSPSSPYDSPDEELSDHMTQLRLKQKSQANSKNRSKAALQASAQVRYPQRPETSNLQYNRHKNTTRASNSSPVRRSKSTGNSSSSKQPIKIPVAASKAPVDTSDDDDLLVFSENEINDEALFKELNIDPEMGRQIMNDMNSNDDEVHWTDIAGLDGAKQALMEAVVWPLLRPDLFTGLRQPPNGMLLFGPPGTGKTMLARAAATESDSNFFSIQASSITSKFLGESEKLVKALFQIAKAKAPSIIFVDEIDSIMGQRSESGENDSMRRVKNEFLVQWSSLTKSAGRGQSSRVLVLAATNLPWAIDDAARRRFVKRQYIPLPEPETRYAQFVRLLKNAENSLSEKDFEELVNMTEGYSGSDIDSLAKDAAMSTTRNLTWEQMMDKSLTVRPISLDDFKVSMKLIKPSVGKENLSKFEKWVKEFGSSGA